MRAEKGGFLELVYDSDAAAEITLQPIRRFGFDGAILFSDILIVPHALGQDLRFEAGEGPRLSPPLVDAALAALEPVPARLEPIYRTVEKVNRSCPPKRLCSASRAARGRSRPTWWRARAAATRPRRAAHAYADPEAFAAIVEAIAAMTVDYLSGQIAGGRRGGAIVRQLGGQPVAGAVRTLGDRADRADRRRPQGAASRTCR